MPRFCEDCGTALSPEAGFCSGCGRKLFQAAHSSGFGGTAVQLAPVREEKVMLEESGISVTSARFIVRGQTYAMNGITSVRALVRNPSKLGPILMILFGLFGIAAYGFMGSAFGVIEMGVVAALGILWFRSKKPSYIVRLTSASGETEAYVSKNGEFVSRVVGAINDAIVHRG